MIACQKPTPPPVATKPVVNEHELAKAAVTNMIGSSKLSAGRQQLTITMLTDIAMRILRTPDERQYWFALLGVESRYDNSAKSHMGAVGIGQLIPKFAADFGKSCGITDVTAGDVTDAYTNAHLSACYFKQLIDLNKGSIPLALVAYNAGPSSADLKKAKQGAAMSNEPSNYVTKVWLKTRGEVK